MSSKIVEMSHNLILQVNNKNLAIDMTLGNGHDSLFLSQHFNYVHSFDIQELAIKRSKKRLEGIDNVSLYLDNFANVDNYNVSNVDLILYNLGFLPGSNKQIITSANDTLLSVKKALKLINKDGLIIICCYLRHEGGMEEYKLIDDFLSKADDKIIAKYQNEAKKDIIITIKNK